MPATFDLPVADSIGVFEAKTHFSRIVDDVMNGRCGPVPVLRRGKAAVYIVSTPFFHHAAAPQPRIRIGLAKGKFTVPDNIDEGNADVLSLFNGGALP